MTMYVTSPQPVPIKKKIRNRNIPRSLLKRYSGGIKLKLPDLFYAKPGGPPLREYKQPMAMYITSPHPGPIKKKIRN